MAQVRLTKKGITLLIVALCLISFGMGYGIWKITGAPYLSSTDSEAGGEKRPERNITKEKLEKCNCSGGGGVPSCGNWCEERVKPDGTVIKAPPEERPPKVCSCASFDNGCGVNCSFPAGTSAAVQSRANASASCQSFIAMCSPDGMSVTYEVFAPGHRCWGKQNECKNPVGNANCACEGGGLLGQERLTTTLGKTVEFCGYAYDADGIDVDNVNVLVDGVAVGKATVTDACADPSDPICVQYKNKKPVKWCYTYTSTEEGDKTISAVWKDSKNIGGASCRAEAEITTSVVQDNWIVDKNAGRVCLDSGETSGKVALNYTITITNSATDSKEISKIVDTLDTKVQSSYIKLESISPSATVAGNVITWNLTGDTAKFNPGQTKTFNYTIEVPKAAFGTYSNNAVITPVGSDANIEVNETVIASCDVPDTALFDTVQSKIAVGVFLILIGILYAYIDPMDTGVGRIFRKISYNMSDTAKVIRSREKFEKRVVS